MKDSFYEGDIMIKLFALILALIVEIWVIYVARETKSKLLIVFSIIQGLNVIWQFTRVIGILP